MKTKTTASRLVTTGLLVASACALSACAGGNDVFNKLNSETSPCNYGQDRRVVVLPLTDYANNSSGDTEQRRALLVTNAFASELVSYGFNLPAQEDVGAFLVSENIHAAVQTVKTPIDHELDREWSPRMAEILEDERNLQAMTLSSTTGINAGVTTENLSRIGKHFQADYILRGQIIEYKLRDAAGITPNKKGFFTSMGLGVSEGLFGAEFPTPTNLQQASVKMRVWVQDAANGEVVWTNSSDVQVEPRFAAGDEQIDQLFVEAVETSAKDLVEDFVRMF